MNSVVSYISIKMLKMNTESGPGYGRVEPHAGDASEGALGQW